MNALEEIEKKNPLEMTMLEYLIVEAKNHEASGNAEEAAAEYAALVERVTCSGCGNDRMVAILSVINGGAACCPDCSTLTVEERNQIRTALDRGQERA